MTFDFRSWMETQEGPPQPAWKSFQTGQQRQFGFAREGPWKRKPDPWVPDYERPSNYEEQKRNVYHVTTNLAGVQKTFGLRSRAQLGGNTAGLGGGWKNESPNMVSTTYSYDKALAIYQALQFMCSVVRNEVSAGQVYDRVMGGFDYYDIEGNEKLNRILADYVPDDELEEADDETIKHYLDQHLQTPQQKYDLYIALEDALGTENDNDGGEYYAPNRVGFTANFQAMARLQHKQIAILQLAVRQGAKSEHKIEEEEIRFHHEDLRVVRYLQP